MVLENRQIEGYLEVMYRKRQNGERITTTSIAKELSVSAASASEMLKKLEMKGFVKVVPYRGAVLTKKGEEAGKAVLRKHHLLEDFLVQFGLEKKIAHREACELEHALSNEAERAFERAAYSKSVRPLCILKAGQQARIVYITGGAGVRRRAMELGLTKGTTIRIVRISRYGCPIELVVRNSEIAIGRGIAEKIYVEAVK